MSADNGYVIRINSKGQYVLQGYFASDDAYPPVDAGTATFDKLEDAVMEYQRIENDSDYPSEYGLKVLVTDKKETPEVTTQRFVRKPFDVNGTQVTSENMEAIARWCHGEIRQSDEGVRYIQVEVRHALNPRQKQAFVGDWVLESPRGFKVYTDSAFKSNFDPDTTVSNVFDTPQELFTTSEQVNPKDQIDGKL